MVSLDDLHFLFVFRFILDGDVNWVRFLVGKLVHRILHIRMGVSIFLHEDGPFRMCCFSLITYGHFSVEGLEDVLIYICSL